MTLPKVTPAQLQFLRHLLAQAKRRPGLRDDSAVLHVAASLARQGEQMLKMDASLHIKTLQQSLHGHQNATDAARETQAASVSAAARVDPSEPIHDLTVNPATGQPYRIYGNRPSMAQMGRVLRAGLAEHLVPALVVRGSATEQSSYLVRVWALPAQTGYWSPANFREREVFMLTKDGKVLRKTYAEQWVMLDPTGQR